MPLLARIAARCRWLCAGETLPPAPPEAPPATTPGPGLRAFFLEAGDLPAPPREPDPRDHRPSFLGWLLTPETLPRDETPPRGAPPATGPRHPRAES